MAYEAVSEAYTVLQEGWETVRGRKRAQQAKIKLQAKACNHLLVRTSTNFCCYSSSSLAVRQ